MEKEEFKKLTDKVALDIEKIVDDTLKDKLTDREVKVKILTLFFKYSEEISYILTELRIANQHYLDNQN